MPKKSKKSRYNNCIKSDDEEQEQEQEQEQKPQPIYFKSKYNKLQALRAQTGIESPVRRVCWCPGQAGLSGRWVP